MASTASPILSLDDDVLRIFGEKVEEESGIVAVAALACSCHAFHTLLQPRASAIKAESLAALCTRLGEDDMDKVDARWRGRGLTDVDLALIASDWLAPHGRLQGLVSLDMWAVGGRRAGGGGEATPNSFGVRGVRALAAALPQLDHLTSLTLERGGEVLPAMLQGAAPSTLNLGNPGPLTACMVGLLAARNPKLKRLKLGDSGNEHLPVRELCGNAPSCQKLDFSSGLWHLGKLSGLAIGAMLSTNATLVYLDLSSNFSPEAGRGAEWAASLALALRTTASLRTLKLRFCALCVEGGIALATALRTTKALTLLDLRDNALLTPVQLLDAEKRESPSDTRAVRALIAALRVNATLPTPLATLRLDNNGLGPTAVDRLRRAAVRGSGDGELKLSA